MSGQADLSSRLGSSDPEARRRATSELLGLHAEAPDATSELLMRALGDLDWRVRKEAVVVALGLAPTGLLLEALVGALGNRDNVGLCNAAAEALGGFGDDAVQAIAGALPKLDADGRKLAVEALGHGRRPAALAVLRDLLDDEDPNVRAATAEAVVSVGVAGVPEAASLLERCLDAADPMVALAALDGLNSLGKMLPWDAVSDCLGVPSLRRPALLAAGRTGDARAVSELFDALQAGRPIGLPETVLGLRELARDPDALLALRQRSRELSPTAGKRLAELAADESANEELRRAALVVMGALGLDEAVDAGLAALSEDRLLAEAHEVFLLLGGRAVPSLVEAVQHSGPARASCLSLLSKISLEQDGPRVREVARQALRDESPEVQHEAIAALARVGDESTLGDLVLLFSESLAGSTRVAAEAALRKLAARYPEAAGDFARRVSPGDPDAYAACVVIQALRGARGSEAADYAFLADALHNPGARVRRAAVDALSGVRRPGTAETVAFALTDEERTVRVAAVAALGRMRDDRGQAAGSRFLIDLVEGSADAELAAAAVRALGETADPAARAAVERLLRSEQPLIAVSAVEALARLARGGDVSGLVGGLEHPDAEVVKASLVALSEASHPALLTYLSRCLEHASWDVRRLAADLIGRVGGDAGLGILAARLEGEDSSLVQDAILRALGPRGSTPVPSKSREPRGAG